MTLSTVNVGTTANDGTGDSLRTAFQTVNTAITAVNAFGTIVSQSEDLVDITSINSGQIGGLRNRFFNGDMSLWQRGTSLSLTTEQYGPDRWLLSGNSATVTQQTFTPGQTDVPGNPTYFVRATVAASGNKPNIGQKIEGVETFAGKEVTLSFWVKASTALSGVYPRIYQQFGSGGSSTLVALAGGSIAMTTSWQKVTLTGTLPSVSGKTIGTGSGLWVQCLRDVPLSGVIDLAAVQLELGGVATPYEQRPIALEQALCARYYQAKTVRSENGARHIPLTPMRVAPTVTVSAGTAGNITTDGFELTHTTAADCTVTASTEI